MASYVAVDKDGTEAGYNTYPERVYGGCFGQPYVREGIKFPLPKGSIEKLIGRKLTWKDEPVELKEE